MIDLVPALFSAVAGSLLWLCLATGSAAVWDRCAACHPKQVRGYARTNMANSTGSPDGHSGGRLRHDASGSRMQIRTGRDGMTHVLERDGLTASHKIEYFIGSGARGRSYAFSIAGRLFQSPASYYTQRRSWDVSPGFEAERNLDFDRPIPPECLFCHAGSPRPVPFTLNGYESPPFESQPITCERCHGAAEPHLAYPSRSNIVNPVRLDARRRDAVCEQCHLGGEARIPNPSRNPWDFRPGELLEDVLTVYVFDRRTPRDNEPLKVVSHVEQLAASKCAQTSGGRLWCGTCHDPHDTPLQPASYYSSRCLQCHDQALAGHRKQAEDCAGCHMPRRPSYDGGHTAFTDHQIRAKPRAATGSRSVPEKLRAWREPAAALMERNLGLAYISAGERHGSAEHLDQGFRHLSEVQKSYASDPAVLTALGVVLQKKRVPREAAKLFLRASELEPRDARHRLNLAVALAEAGEVEQAIAALESAISLDPSLRDAYVLLAEIYDGLGAAEERRKALRRYLEFAPQSIIIRKMLARD